MKTIREEFSPAGTLQFTAKEGRKYITILKYGRQDMAVKVPKGEYNPERSLEDQFCEFGS